MRNFDKLILAVDFDGTCVTNDFPDVGKNIGAEIVLKQLVKDGAKIILHTMRSHPSDKTKNAKGDGIIPTGNDCLQDAINWFKINNIPLFGINENPEQHTWTDSPKPYAHRYIDDSALGVPLFIDNETKKRFVDWMSVARMLYGNGAEMDKIMDEFSEKYPTLVKKEQ